MLRKTVAAWTALRRRAVASIPAPSIPIRAISTAPIRAPRVDHSVHHRPSHRLVLLPIAASSRGYARMARRSPPVQTKPEEEEESEEEMDLDLAPVEEEEDVESEEWEGFVLDFGSDGKDKDEREDEQDS
ncbi:hypothetical protein COCNU_03G011620 [Cocos nucifera]|uniref:Uncharacterized protein n=1 Tax=Cocos nucifera TaxID=13894 RepID=A0A8K0I3F7_COCNU|nr:hypothetical protein COCNU_03G011620 [Cocos nucifera]